MGITPLWTSFFQLLQGETVCIPRRLRCRGELPQCITVGLLLEKWKLCRVEAAGREVGRWGGVVVAALGGGEVACRWVLARSCAEAYMPVFSPPEYPRIVIDLWQWGEHTEGERHELVEQILAALNVVRTLLWDRNLWLTHVPREFLEYLSRHARGLRHKMNITWEPPPFRSPVVLDPEGPCVLTKEEVFQRSELVVGGIVDKERVAKGATERLAWALGVERRCRIELRGSTVGVPDRVNKVVEILVRILAGEPLEAAILKTQAKRDRVYRLMWEIQRRAKRRGGVLTISRVDLAEANWLGASGEEVALAVRKTGVVVS